MAKGIMPPWQARERAQRAAFAHLQGRARYITLPKIDDPAMTKTDKRKITWAMQNQVSAYFKPGPVAYWRVTLD